MSSVRDSESSCLSSVRRSDPPYLFQFGVQSRIFILAFRAIVQYGIRCQHLSLVLMLRAIVRTHSDILSHHIFSFLAFRLIFSPNFSFTVIALGIHIH